MFLKTLFTIFLFLLLSKSWGQDAHTLLLEKHTNKSHKHSYLKEISFQNEPSLVFSGLYVFYKTFISSQDQGSCNFTPSCSSYGLHSIQKKGVFKGILNTFDRLSRCNGMNKKDYEIDIKTGLLIDYVE